MFCYKIFSVLLCRELGCFASCELQIIAKQCSSKTVEIYADMYKGIFRMMQKNNQEKTTNIWEACEKMTSNLATSLVSAGATLLVPATGVVRAIDADHARNGSSFNNTHLVQSAENASKFNETQEQWD